MTKQDVKKVRSVITQLAKLESKLAKEGERDVSSAVQAAKRELDTPLVHTYLAAVGGE